MRANKGIDATLRICLLAVDRGGNRVAGVSMIRTPKQPYSLTFILGEICLYQRNLSSLFCQDIAIKNVDYTLSGS